MKDEVTSRQQNAWALAAASVPAVMVCAQEPWQKVGVGALGAVAILEILWILRRISGVSWRESYENAFGNGIGKGMLTLTAAWTFLTLANTVAGAGAAFPESEESKLAPAVLLILTALASGKGNGAAARCGAIAAPILGGLYLVLLTAAVPDIKIEWCQPWEGGQPLRTTAAMLLPVTALLTTNSEQGKAPVKSWASLVVLPTAMACVTAGCLSPQITRKEELAFYTLTKNLNLLGTVERFEPIVSAGLYLGLFSMATLLCRCVLECGKQITQKQEGIWQSWATCAAAFGASWAAPCLPERIWNFGSATFWGMIPILAQVVAGIKKVEKKRKKVLTNGDDFGNIAERSREGNTADGCQEKTSKNDEKSS